MKEGDEWKAVFRMNGGLFELLVMFFGLTNSPSTFQTMMNKIFQDLIMEGAICVYLNDILIFTKSLEEHRQITRLVLEWLREHKLFLRHDKCKFEATTIEYLRLIISEGEIRVSLATQLTTLTTLTPTYAHGAATVNTGVRHSHQELEGVLNKCSTD
jgi:hypothetical protein